MHGSRKIKISEINQQLTCVLCKGYFIDATTIVECLHTFCRSCIVRYLQTNKYCPVCEVQVHKTKPLLNIRPDKTIQDVVYKLVPKLFQNEMQRRRDFYAAHAEAKPSSFELGNEAAYQHLLSPDETICLSLSYHGSNGTTRYFRCPAAVSVAHLQKLIRAKYDLTDKHRVDVMYNQDCLNMYLTLVDVACIYLWRKKGPLELTYRIYEHVPKKQKPEDTAVKEDITTSNNNNDWKEVQLRISENGEMSVTGVNGDNSSEQTINVIEKSSLVTPPVPVSVSDIKNCESVKAESDSTKTSDCDVKTSETVTSACSKTESLQVTVVSKANNLVKAVNEDATPTSATTSPATITTTSSSDIITKITSSGLSSCTLVVSSKDIMVKPQITSSTTTVSVLETRPSVTISNNVVLNKPDVTEKKHKLQDGTEGEPPQKQPKPTILNHSLGLQNLSNNHPLKKHSQAVRCLENTQIKPANVISKPSTPITSNRWQQKSTPIYQPKTYAPIINVPKPKTDVTTPTTSVTTKMTIKTKPSTPIGYKTLRDPPKSWNPQIPRSNLAKPIPDLKQQDVKNVRPAKFFKIRNNMPRYLGNPASGVKPMYQVHLSPDKDKTVETPKPEKSEIKKHSIVKIDPKTLKPISEKAPETTSLSSQSDLKINTSSVSIFNPLKLQSSPKNERKSPHSPKLKSNSPTNKREKLNLNFTPSNPFIPNLASPTVSPNQFLYPSGPPGFPSYDPRFMAAYHSLLYGQRMPFTPSPLQALTLDLNQRKAFEIGQNNSPGPSSPKIAKKSSKDGQKLEKSLEKLTQNRVKNERDKNDGSDKLELVKKDDKCKESGDKSHVEKQEKISNNNTESVASLVVVEEKK